MKMILLSGRDPHDTIKPEKTWLVIADDEATARTLIPADLEDETLLGRSRCLR